MDPTLGRYSISRCTLAVDLLLSAMRCARRLASALTLDLATSIHLMSSDLKNPQAPNNQASLLKRSLSERDSSDSSLKHGKDWRDIDRDILDLLQFLSSGNGVELFGVEVIVEVLVVLLIQGLDGALVGVDGLQLPSRHSPSVV